MYARWLTVVLLTVVFLTPSLSTGAPTQGRRVVIGIQQEPANLNPYMSAWPSWVIAGKVLDGLIGVDPKGQFYPILVEKVPTVANGLVSADGTRVTYKLRKGIVWSDGRPFTARDVAFTWNVLKNEANPLYSRAGYDLVTGVNTPDDYTAVVSFKQPYAPYLTLSGYVLPADVFGGQTDISKSAFNRRPGIGTGPFVVAEWSSGSYIRLTRNPRYRLAGRPFLDEVIFKIVPSLDAGAAQLRAGELDVLTNASIGQIPDFESIPGVYVRTTESTLNERILLNLGKRGNPGDPTQPHPILGDVRVRRALDQAINKDRIIRTLLFGRSSVPGSVVAVGWASDRSIKPRPYDPEAATRLLEEAGWRVGPDGIRRKDSQRLQLELFTTTGNKLRESATQVVRDDLRQVGVEVTIRLVPPTILFALWADGGLTSRGDFDMSMSADGPFGANSIDPDLFLSSRFHSSAIPTPQGGYNSVRFRNADFDRLRDQAASTVDLKERYAAYARAQRIIQEEAPVVLMWRHIWVDVFSRRLAGYRANPFGEIGWDLENWIVR